MLRTWFMPNAVGTILFGLLVVASILPRSILWAGMTVNVLFWRIGLPTVVEDPRYLLLLRDSLAARWPELLATAVGIYIVVIPLGRLASGGWGCLRDAPRRRGWRRPGAIVSIVVIITLAAALITAMIISKRTWGYYMWRPKLDARVRGATALVSCTAFRSEPAPGGVGFQFAPNPAIQFHEWARLPERSQGDYYSHSARALVAMRERNLLAQPLPQMQPERLAPLHALLDASKLLDSGDPEYIKWLGNRNRAKHLRGYVLEFHGPGGEPLMLICASSGEVADDTYAYYEFLFAREDPLRLVSSVKFYYDSAGIEGFEWPAIWTALGAIGLACTLPATLIVMIVRRLLEYRRQPGRGFPVRLRSASS